jgi:hypothetical protein
MTNTLLVVLMLLAASSAHAQDLDHVAVVSDADLQLTSIEQRELEQWTGDVRNYEKWYQRNRNRISRNIFGIVTTRRQLPAVPDWLPATCDLLANFVPPPPGLLPAACDLLAYYDSDFTQDPAAQQAALTRQQNEQDPHSSFWKHVHLDAAWSSLDYRMHTYGLVGVHVTLPEIAKRIQVFLPPGFLLLSIPDGHGGRQVQPAATVGVSIKLFDFEFPQDKAGTVYFNLAKAYVLNHQASMGDAAVDLMGLSFSWGR